MGKIYEGAQERIIQTQRTARGVCARCGEDATAHVGDAEQFISHGHDARLLSDRRIVIRLGNGRWFRVVGGDFRSPSLLECSEQPPEPGMKP